MELTKIKDLIPAPSDGIQGPLGYIAGEWDIAATYERTEYLSPIVLHKGSYWYLRAIGESKGDEPSAASTTWKLATNLQIVFAEILMAAFGKLASAIFSGPFMFSQYGKLNGRTINEDSADKESAYKNFDFSDPKNASKFVPNLMLNFLTGLLYAKKVEIEGTVRMTAGYIGDENNGGLRVTKNGIGANKEDGSGFSIRTDYIRVGDKKSYVEMGQDIAPGTSGGAYTANMRLWNCNALGDGCENYGLLINVGGSAGKYYGVMVSIDGAGYAFKGNGAVRGSAVYGDKYARIYFSSSSTNYTLDFSACNYFYFYATQTCEITLPTETVVAKQFGYTMLPSDFGYAFTVIAEAGTRNFTIKGVVDANQQTVNHEMGQGDVTTFFISKRGGFHYKILSYIK